jgi:hypothetical protein
MRKKAVQKLGLILSRLDRIGDVLVKSEILRRERPPFGLVGKGWQPKFRGRKGLTVPQGMRSGRHYKLKAAGGAYLGRHIPTVSASMRFVQLPVAFAPSIRKIGDGREEPVMKPSRGPPGYGFRARAFRPSLFFRSFNYPITQFRNCPKSPSFRKSLY